MTWSYLVPTYCAHLLVGHAISQRKVNQIYLLWLFLIDCHARRYVRSGAFFVSAGSDLAIRLGEKNYYLLTDCQAMFGEAPFFLSLRAQTWLSQTWNMAIRPVQALCILSSSSDLAVRLGHGQSWSGQVRSGRLDCQNDSLSDC